MGHGSPRSGHRNHHAFGGHRDRWERAWFAGPPWAGGRRARRGDVRTALLRLLSDQPMHGYDLIREIDERSGGAWRPSPGSIYPTLQLLEDEGLVTDQEQDGKRVYTITDAGRAELRERQSRGGSQEPWEFGPVGKGLGQLRDSGGLLVAAAMQVARTGSEDQRAQAAEILADARKKLYALLAED